ncbi:MAG: NADPH:quinone oxidoreductase [Frankiales bacterium]|nr:NADPH:quinone oxidoreductase [Frankiales bacterium]
MRAVRCTAYGEPEGLTLAELPDPVPGPGELVVDVEAAAVNFTDVLFVADRYQVRAPLPFTPGSEFAGRVAATGPGTTGFVPGNRVRGTGTTGAFAEKVLVPATAVVALPPDADPVLAAASGVASATAYSALRSVAAVTPGEWVAVTGAAGGVGSAAIVLARALGARVLAIVSTPAKADFCTGLGADAVLDLSSTPDVKRHVRTATGGGAAVVLDLVGGDLAETLLRALGRGGRFVTVGYASGVIPRIPLNLVLLKGVSVLGFEIRTFADDHPELAARDLAELGLLQADGLGATVTARYPLARAAEALRSVADRRAMGKVVLDLGPDAGTG